MADEREEQPEADAPEEQAEEPAAEPARETAVGHQVVDAGEAEPGDTSEVFFSHDEPTPQPAPAPPADSGGTSPAAADRAAAEAKDSFTEKPQVFVAAAFVGAFVVGKLLRKLTRSDD